jgi:hypothetical protein
MAAHNGGRAQPSSSLTELRVRSHFYSGESEEESHLGIEQECLQHTPRSGKPYNYNPRYFEKNHIPHSPSSQTTHLTQEEPTVSDLQEDLEHTDFQSQPGSYGDDVDQDENHIASDDTFAGAYSHSKTWVSWQQMVMDKWRTIQPKLMRMYPIERNPEKVCPFVPRNSSEWCQHIAELNAAEQAFLERKLKQYEENKNVNVPEIFKVKAFMGMKFGSMEGGDDLPPEVDNFMKKMKFRYNANPPTRGYVLSERTIWCPAPSVPWRQQPAWPCKAEMDWEGDQRVATENGRFGRYPPLPRIDPNNDSVAWHLKPRLRPYPFDDPWLVPTMEDIYLPVDQIEDPEIIGTLLNSDLFLGIDNPPIPVRDPNSHLHSFTIAGAERNSR